MSWDWTLLLIVDAAALVLCTLVILGLFVRDLRRARRLPPGEPRQRG